MLSNKNLIIIALSFFAILFSSCSLLFMKEKQTISIQTEEDNTLVYLNNTLIDIGIATPITINKTGAKQVVLKTSGYKEEYIALVLTKTNPWVYPLGIVDFFPYIYTLGTYKRTVLATPKTSLYNNSYFYKNETPFIYKNDKEKYVKIALIHFDIKNFDRDLIIKNVYWDENINEKLLMKTEIEVGDKLKEEKSLPLSLVFDEYKKPIVESKITSNINKLLIHTGYIDTSEKVSYDINNSLILKGMIKTITEYNVISKKASQTNRYKKYKIDMVWNCYTIYNELLESIEISSFSGDFVEKMDKASIYTEALEKNLLELQQDSLFRLLKQKNASSEVALPPLTINFPKKHVKNLSDASAATVSIKRNDKVQGSGFVISNDGYVLTSFQAIADKTLNMQESITIQISSGQELNAKIVRYNKIKDVALLKVDTTFDMGFLINTTSKYSNLTEVFTIGAISSTESGLSISKGLIYNTQSAANNDRIQLNTPLKKTSIGGPIFENDGTLHGIIQKKYYDQSSEGLSFGTPIYLISEYLKLTIK